MKFKEFFSITEAIRLKHAKKMRLTRSSGGAYKIPSIEKVFGDKDRLVYDINIDYKKTQIEDIPLILKINNFLQKHFSNLQIKEIDEYKKGIVFFDTDKEKKQGRRIGKILNSFPNDEEAVSLLKAYKMDSSRVKGSDYRVVISRHPYDIAGMSTDRNWTSCMNLGYAGVVYSDKPKVERGINAHYIRNDITAGSIVAYLVPSTDRTPNGKIEIKRPLSRILMKPHQNNENQNDIVYSMGRIYGVGLSDFRYFIEQWLKKNINVNTENKKYHLMSGLYMDGDTAVNFNVTSLEKNIAENTFFDMLDYENEKYRRFFEFQTYGRDQTGGELKITFQIPTEIDLKKFDYYYPNIPDFIKPLLKSKNLPKFENLYLIEYFEESRELVIEYRFRGFNFGDDFDDPKNAWIMDDDYLEDIWREFFSSNRIERIKYPSAKKEILEFLKTTNVARQKQNTVEQQEKSIIDEITELLNPDSTRTSPRLKEQVKKLINDKHDFSKTSDEIRKFAETDPSYEDLVEFYTKQNGKNLFIKYHEYIKEYRHLITTIDQVLHMSISKFYLLSHAWKKQIVVDILAKHFDITDKILATKMFRPILGDSDSSIDFFKTLVHYKKIHGNEKYEELQDIIYSIEHYL